MTVDAIKRAVTMEQVLEFYGSEYFPKIKKWRCLFPERHTNGDRDPSLTNHHQRVTCHSKGCFKGEDIFAVVGIMENLASFSEQMKWLEATFQLNGHDKSQSQGARNILRGYKWVDAQGHHAWHLRLDGG